MLKDRAREYYIDKDYNCAESLILAINDEYGLGLDTDTLKLVSGFGLGMGCKRTCGALCSSISALGKLLVQDRAHATPNFTETCADYVAYFTEKLGSDQCDRLRDRYRKDDTRCLEKVELAADVFSEFISRR